MKNVLYRTRNVLLVISLSIALCGCGSKTDDSVKMDEENNISAEENNTSAEENNTSVEENVSYKTYETETFDGTVLKIDETNIISQEKVEDVLETTLVPSDAEVIAPGRDFVYLEDAENYYVEDTVDQLLTIAKKSDTAKKQN